MMGRIEATRFQTVKRDTLDKFIELGSLRILHLLSDKIAQFKEGFSISKHVLIPPLKEQLNKEILGEILM